MVALANRNGFYCVLDRVTGKFIDGRAYVKQTWASGLDETGRPMRLPDAEPSVEGKLIWPSLGGGSNWYSSTYSPKTELYYVNVKEEGAIYHKGEAGYKPGALFNGGGTSDYKGEQPYGAVRALEVATGRLRWEYKLFRPSHSGLMTTAGGLVFGIEYEFVLRARRAERRPAVALRDRERYRRQSGHVYVRREAVRGDRSGPCPAGLRAGSGVSEPSPAILVIIGQMTGIPASGVEL